MLTLITAVIGIGAGPAVRWVAPATPTYTNTRTVVTTVTTQSGWATNYPHQRKVFRIAGLWWLFYGDGTNQVYRTSADAVTWGDPVTVRSGTGLGHRIGYWFDGVYIHYAYNDATNGGDIFYRRGTPDAESVITWSAVEQTVVDLSTSFAGGYPSVTVDTNGAPWVSAMVSSDPAWTAPHEGRVYKSSATDGTWTTQSGFPVIVATGFTTTFNYPECVPLRAGKVFCGWPQDGAFADVLLGNHWNGSAWDGVEDTTVSISNAHNFNLVAEGDAVHMVFIIADRGYSYRRRSAAGTWGAETELIDTQVVGGPAAIGILGYGGRVRMYWPDTDSDLIRTRTGDPAQISTGGNVNIDETTDDLSGNQIINVASSGEDHLLVYTTKLASPFDLVALLIERN